MIYDVVIASAGPVGLFLACELRLADLKVLVLEQAEDPGSPLKRLPFGMRGLSAPTIEALYRRGLLNDITAPQPAKDDSAGSNASAAGQGAQQPRRQAGHFAGIPFDNDNIDTAKWSYRLPGQAATSMAADMERIESVLAARASAMGVEIRRGLAVEDLDQFAEEIKIRAGGETSRGRWLVGCDGGRSTVRKVCDFEFAGTDPEFTGYSVLVEMADPDKLKTDGTKLGELLTKGRGLLLDFDARTSLQALANRWCGRVTYVGSNAKNRLGVSALLVRPDGVVAWACEALPHLEEAVQATSRWFGDPDEARESA